MTKLLLYGLLACLVASVSGTDWNRDVRSMLVHYERFEVRPETETFLEVSDEQNASWEELIEQCTPIDTREPLSESCMLLAEQYFSKEPVWPYSQMYYYDAWDGWVPIFIRELTYKNFTTADYVDKDVPYWNDVFDGQIEQRKKQFLKVVADSSCLDLASRNKLGIHPTNHKSCAARELYKYGAYLNACSRAHQRLSFLSQEITQENQTGELNYYELSFSKLDEWVSDVPLRYSAKRRLAKGFLHASWVAEQCKVHGFVLVPGQSHLGLETTEEKMSWEHDLEKYFLFVNHAYDLALRIAAKTGDDWAIRSRTMGRYLTDEFNEDLLKRYPLQFHREMGKGAGYDFTPQEKARHRAKAYLLLVEQAGEKVAQLEYDPSKLKREIRYVKNGGSLRFPPSRAEILKETRKWLQEYEEDEMLKEMKGELF
ncbi:MAG: hypothetical protein F4W92_10165 [Gammaproteobacteria bacterium]|nr:hypothetical protein [Gammaproteobacteria bacterium]